MKEFETTHLSDDIEELQRLGYDLNAVIKITEDNAILYGAYIHEDEFKSYSDYKDYVEPLYGLPEFLEDDSDLIAAIRYISLFYYSKGLEDGPKFKDLLFDRHEKS